MNNPPQERMVWNETLAKKLMTQWNDDPDGRHYYLLKHTAAFIPEECKEVLDVGCGFGDLWPFLEQKGFTPEQYCGIDPSRAMLSRARTRFPQLDFQQGDVFTQLPASAFDCVVSCSLLVHLWNKEKAIQHMWNHTRRCLVGNFVVGEFKSRTESRIGVDDELIHHIPVVWVQEILNRLGGVEQIGWKTPDNVVYFFRVWRKCL